ncbi:MAG: AlpA family phage regulatory protein [Burkholderiaceae bacterium]|nr:AlpA family phage regulatory protein [Burkholderiaceae bacterium]
MCSIPSLSIPFIFICLLTTGKTEAPRLGVLFLTLPEVAKITNLGQSTVRKFSKEGKYGFPRSYKLDTLTRWKTDEVLEWIRNFQG